MPKAKIFHGEVNMANKKAVEVVAGVKENGLKFFQLVKLQPWRFGLWTAIAVLAGYVIGKF